MYQSRDSRILDVKNLKSTVDISFNEYRIGKETPKKIMEILEKNSIIGTLALEGDEIYAVETYIPAGTRVYVVGTYIRENGKDFIVSADSSAKLTVSYEDPETSKLI